MNEQNDITYFGVTNYRNKHQRFGIRDADRLGHIYVIGKTGVGKSTLLKTMALSDIRCGKGICTVDPHGDIAKDLLALIPDSRKKDLIYFDATDTEHPIAFNPLHNVPEEFHHLAASELISTFKKIWESSWGPRLEYILRYSLLTLLSYPDATLLDIQPLLTDLFFREKVLTYCASEHIHAFWEKEFAKYSPALKAEAISPILNKVGIFQTSIPLKNIVGQKESNFTMQQVMDEGKILIVNLAKGTIGEETASLIGSMLVTAIQLTAMRRANVQEHERRPFYLYIDECHSFITLSFVDILAEARKYKLSLFLAHQYIEQLHEKIRAAIFGNVGTLICFRVGATDAEYIIKEFAPIFTEGDLVNLPKYSMCLKLMIGGATSKPFSAKST